MPVFIPLQKLQVSHHGRNEAGWGAVGEAGELTQEDLLGSPLGSRCSPAGRGGSCPKADSLRLMPPEEGDGLM